MSHRAASEFVRWTMEQEPSWLGYGAVGRLHARKYNTDSSIVVSGVARSGTTWLMEMIAGITGSVTVNEPETPSRPRRVKRHLGYELTARIYKDPDVDDPSFTRALTRILSGGFLRPSSVTHDLRTTVSLLRGAPLIIKFIRANLFLPYLHARFPRTKVVQIIRDPFATIASQLIHPGVAWQARRPLTRFDSPAIDAIVDVAAPLNLNSPDEVLAAHWCLEHAWLEKNLDRLTGVHLVRYEDLRSAPEKSLRDLTAYLHEPWDESFLALAARPSRSTRPESALMTNPDSTRNDKRVLSEERRHRIGKVLDAFDRPFYP